MEAKTNNEIFEADVTTYDALSGYVGKIKAGAFARMGYIESVKLSKSRRYVNQDNLDKLKSAYKDSDDKPLQRRFMGSIIPDAEEYLAGDGKRKTMDFNFGEDVELINYVVFQMNWLTNENLANIERKKQDEILKLRKLYGFGEPGSENTWRAKGRNVKKKDGSTEFQYSYGGPGLLPITKGGKSGSGYTQSADGGEESDERNKWIDPETGKAAFRQRPSVIESHMFLFDAETGDVEEFDKNLYFILKNEFGAAKSEKAVEELEDDERSYKEALAKIYDIKELQSAHTYLEDKTLWMAYTIIMPDKSKQPSKRWLNKELVNKYRDIFRKLNIEDKMRAVEDFSDAFGKDYSGSKELNEAKSLMSRMDII